MKCPSCGRECVDESNYCFYCGYSFREAAIKAVSSETAKEAEVVTDEITKNADTEEKAMSHFWWILYFCTLLTPFTYPVFIFLTAKWAFGSSGSRERKNFAKGLMIFVATLFVACFVLAIVYVAAFGVDGAINKLTNGAATNADAYFKMITGEK